MNKSKLMLVLGFVCIVLALFSLHTLFECGASMLFQWSGPLSLLVLGIAILHAKHHKH